MIYRYGTDKKGGCVKTAAVYTREEHPLRKQMISPQAMHVVRTLRQAGYQAFIVGGAVRDLLMNKIPKDFDVVTDAVPNRIKKIFSNAWVIGKRFKLTHVVFPGRYIVEVTTFRSESSDNFNAVYGTIDEDVYRRDFSVNALFYDPVKEQLIDYVGGYRDIKTHRLSNIIPLRVIFDSDPVRMLRAVKYSAKCELKIPLRMKSVIRKKASLLSSVSVSRLTEEFFKIMASGKSTAIFKQMDNLNLLKFFLPEVASLLHHSKSVRECFFRELESWDQAAAEHTENGIGRESLLFHFFYSFLPAFSPHCGYQENVSSSKDFCKHLQSPLQFPVAALESAVKSIYETRDGVCPPCRSGGSKKSYHRRANSLRGKNSDLTKNGIKKSGV